MVQPWAHEIDGHGLLVLIQFRQRHDDIPVVLLGDLGPARPRHGGEALHGYIRASYGFPQSLGCVEMPFATAGQVWPHTPIGTLVTVRP